jgi:hypothetical protein
MATRQLTPYQHMRVYEKMEAEIGCNCESFILKTHISLRTIIV